MQPDAMLRRAQAGDAHAFDELMAGHEKRIYALCLRLSGNGEDALDCAQEAMLRIWRSISSFRNEASFATWAYRIATNVCIDSARKKKLRPTDSLNTMVEEGKPEPISSGNDPEARAMDSARNRALADGIATLPLDLRTALILRDVHGFSYEEVTEILRLPLGTVKSRINRAREKLRAILSQSPELFGMRRVYTARGGQMHEMR
ncbi:MAG: sigma-70 family RNA polymerase sigma factor [Clostridia bacterium]|nr:sigma-70 family RNA polymerase sigma factor [Clostridia bacterium]